MAPKVVKAVTPSERKSTRVVVPTPKPVIAAPKVKKVSAKKAAPKPKKRAPVESEDEEEDSADEAPAPKKARVAPSERVTLPKAEKVEKVPKEKKENPVKYTVGDIINDSDLQNEQDVKTSFASLFADNGLVVFSYPKANTPGCTTQACNFRDAHDDIVAAGYKIVGLSTDLPGAQLSWKTTKEFQYPLLSDPTSALLKSLGAIGGSKRSSWIIAKGGKLLAANLGVKPADDAANALAFIKAL